MYSDPVSRHMRDAPHPHTRDHSSNALALAQGRSAKERMAHLLNSMHAITTRAFLSRTVMRLPDDVWTSNVRQRPHLTGAPETSPVARHPDLRDKGRRGGPTILPQFPEEHLHP